MANKFGNRTGPRLDPKDVMQINDLWNIINQIYLTFEVDIPDRFPRKVFSISDYPRNMSADDKGWKLMGFTLNVTEVAIAIIAESKEDYNYEVTEREYKFVSTDTKATELYMKYKEFGKKTVALFYIDKLTKQIEFIYKNVIPNNFNRRKNARRIA